jgi:hypothetical protein
MGSGHFSLLEVPEQINAMLERFMTISVGGTRTPPVNTTGPKVNFTPGSINKEVCAL